MNLQRILMWTPKTTTTTTKTTAKTTTTTKTTAKTTTATTKMEKKKRKKRRGFLLRLTVGSGMTLFFFWEHQDIKHSTKIASFDFDGCLAKTSLFKKGPDAWSVLFPSIPEKLKKLHDDGFKLVIFTNQSDIGKAAKPETRLKAINEKKGRLMGFTKQIGLPFQIFVATSKTTQADEFRKPGTEMWNYMAKNCNGELIANISESFFVGDAAGRKKDHSDSDKKFAEALSLKFYTEDYFQS